MYVCVCVCMYVCIYIVYIYYIYFYINFRSPVLHVPFNMLLLVVLCYLLFVSLGMYFLKFLQKQPSYVKYLSVYTFSFIRN